MAASESAESGAVWMARSSLGNLILICDLLRQGGRSDTGEFDLLKSLRAEGIVSPRNRKSRET